MNTIVSPLSVVMYNYLCKNNDKTKIVLIKRVMLILSFLMIFLVYPIQFIVEIWLDKYQEASYVVFILFSSQVVSIIIRCIHTNLYKANKKQNQYFGIMGFIILFSLGMNFLCYAISKTIESFAIATLFTNILWFVIGEFHFKEYRLKGGDYICILCILVLFLTTGYFCRAIYGGILYTILTIFLLFVFMNPTLKTCYAEIKYIIRKR